MREKDGREVFSESLDNAAVFPVAESITCLAAPTTPTIMTTSLTNPQYIHGSGKKFILHQLEVAGDYDGMTASYQRTCLPMPLITLIESDGTKVPLPPGAFFCLNCWVNSIGRDRIEAYLNEKFPRVGK